jgi:tetratricopeptide (TPR) repeat protein
MAFSDSIRRVNPRRVNTPRIHTRRVTTRRNTVCGVAVMCGLAVLAAACSNPDVEKVRHFERGNEYAAEKRDDFAVIEYASAVRLDPMYGEARLKLAETHERMNNMRAAAPEYIRAADALPDNRDAQIKATQILLLAGRFEDAKARAGKLLEKDPKDLDALLLSANAMAALKDPAGALDEIEEALQVKPDESRTFVNLGAIRMQAGEAKEAEAAFRQAIALAPDSVEAHLALGNFLWAAERVPEAEQAIKQAISIEPQHLLANRMLGILYLATQRSKEAELPLKAVADVAKTPAARLQLADYYLGTNRAEDAKAILTELAKDQSAFADAELRLAAIDYAEKRQADAHTRLDGVISRVSTYTPALVQKAQWLTAEGKLDEALATAQAAVTSNPESAPAHFALATVQSHRREVGEAVKSYTEVLRLNPRAVAAQMELSRLNLATGDRDSALRFAEEARRTEPANVAARVALARTLLSRGDLTRAQTEIAELQRRLPDAAIVHALSGNLDTRRGQFAAARKSFERAQELSPGLLEALAGLVALDVQAKQIGNAMARVDNEIARQGEQPRPEVLVLAAQVYGLAGQPERREQALRQAVAVDPRFSTGYAMLAQFYMQQKRLDEAKTEFEGMVKRDPSSPGPRTMVGAILEAQGKREEAKRWYEETVAAVKDAPIVANNLAYIYAEEGTNLDMALQLATTAKQGLPDSPDVDDTLGWIYYKKDMASLAIRPLEESLKRRPDAPEVLYHLGLAYAKTGDEAKAREALERALKLNPQFPGNDVARQTLSTFSR